MKYVTEVQLSPQIHEGHMAYYWQIVQIHANGSKFTIAHGWSNNSSDAHGDAWDEAHDRGLVK